jgi:hypothetical protein
MTKLEEGNEPSVPPEKRYRSFSVACTIGGKTNPAARKKTKNIRYRNRCMAPASSNE